MLCLSSFQGGAWKLLPDLNKARCAFTMGFIKGHPSITLTSSSNQIHGDPWHAFWKTLNRSMKGLTWFLWKCILASLMLFCCCCWRSNCSWYPLYCLFLSTLFKDIDRPFELRGESRLIWSIMTNWRLANFFYLILTRIASGESIWVTLSKKGRLLKNQWS
jgi:hypothetical protein